MYGTIARLKVKPGALEAIREMESRQPPGFIRTLVYQMDRDANELYMVVVFENREAYFSNAADPQQHAEFINLMKYLEVEPEWNDGEIIFEATAS